MLKAIIIDDEPKAIQSLNWELAHFETDIQIVATFTEPENAIDYINKAKIDCIFLDIEMPTMDGFQFLEKLSHRNFATIITTAYNEYAITALKKEAIDYLLKPVDADDLKLAIEKVKKHKNQKLNPDKFEDILMKFNEKLTHKKITINADGKLIFLEPNEILYVMSDGNYSTLYLENKKEIVVTKKIKEVVELLPSDYFFRIHNSYVVNLNKIKEFLKTDGYVILENGAKIPVSRQRKSEFLERF